MHPDPVIRHLGILPYEPVYREMRSFTDRRRPESDDEIWVLQHEPVYTLGLGAKPDHVLDPGTVPVVRSDRGGEVTYHGPGQLLVYVLLDIERRRVPIRALVSCLEQAVIDTVAPSGIDAHRIAGAPGVYVDGRKLAALGLRIRRGHTYHGLAVNVDGDLSPFAGINPCGYPGLPVTRITDLGIAADCETFADRLLPEFCRLLAATSENSNAPYRHRQRLMSQTEFVHG